VVAALLAAAVSAGAQAVAPAAGPMAAPIVADVPAAAATEAGARPRIGLALSGGGARGFSHVGVLKALEALRVPVDCIAGTSAGSAVGAAYAVGLAPDQIEAQLRQADWGGGMFSDQPSRPELPYRSKSRVGGEPIGATFGIGPDGLRSSSGIFAGQQIELFLHRLLALSTELGSFEELPVPVPAGATDLVTGQMVVQRAGSLVHAVRASMAVPSAFAPVKVDERLLVDGGLTQNLPVQAVREACADVVIAVNIGSPLLGADELGSVFGVGLQMVSILMERNVAESIAALTPRDVLIVPDLAGVSAVDFAHGIDGIPAGERATLAAADRLRHLTLSPEAYAAWQAARRDRAVRPPLVDEVKVAPTRFVPPAFFALTRKSDAPGPVDVEGLHRRIRQWSGSGDFTNIAYSVRPSGSGYTLWIDPQEKPWGPDYLQLGFAGQVDSNGNTDFSVQAALRRTWLNAWGAEWLTVARFGGTRELETRWFQPLGAGSAWFVEPRARLSSEPLRVFAGDRAVGEFRIDRREIELGAGWQGPQGLAQISAVAARIETEPVLGLLTVPASQADVDGLRLTLAVDRLDDLDFPRDGHAVRLDAFHALRGLGADTGYRRTEAEGVVARSWGDHTLRLRARWARVSGDDVRDFVSVGGFLNLSGYQPEQFVGEELTLLSAGYSRRLLSLPQPFGSGLFAGMALEAARIGSPLGFDIPALHRHGAVAYLGAATALGPAYLGLGLGQDGNRALYVLLGRP